MIDDNKKDELYLNHISNILGAELHGRMSYLQFLVTINIALYVAIYYSTDKLIWAINGIKLFLLLLLIIVNYAFSRMYLREHNITRIRDQRLLAELNEESNDSVAHRFKEALDSKDHMRSQTWETTKLIFSIFHSIPIVYFCLLLLLNTIFNMPNYPKGIEWHGIGYIEILFGILVACVTWGFLHHFSDKEFKRGC